jgi:hypothetical protein
LGDKIDKFVSLELAGKAYVETFTRQRIFEALKVTGMVPITSEPLLTNPRINDGDVMRTLQNQRFAQHTGTYLQTPPALRQEVLALTTTSVAQVASTTEAARAVFALDQLASFSKKNTRLGKWRSTSKTSTPLNVLQKTKLSCLTSIETLISERESSLPASINSLRESLSRKLVEAQRVRDEAQRALDELKGAIESGADVNDTTQKLEQEISYLGVFRTAVEQMDPNADRRALSVVSEKVEDLQNCKRDSYGLCLSADSKTLMSAPVISSVQGIHAPVLQMRVDSATAGLALNAGVGGRGRGPCT